jgi:hypothetical protein
VLDQPCDLVPLGRVWEFPHDQAAILMAEIERLFRDVQAPLFGRRPGNVNRELIAFPVDYEIDWLGQTNSRGEDYCEPRACRRVDLSAPWRKEYDRDVFEDLVIPRAQWNQMARKLGLSEALPSQSPVIGSAAPAAEEPRGSEMLHGDIWLTPTQAVYFFVTGDNLIEVSRLSLEVVIGRLARIQSASVPLSSDAGPEERAAALKEVKELLAAAGPNPSSRAIKWRDNLLATGLVAAEGRRTPFSLYESIKPVEFSDLQLAGSHAENATGDVVFYNVRLSGSGLWKARQQAVASNDTAPSIEAAKAPSDQLPPHTLPERSNAAPGRRAVPEPDSIPLIEAVHELRITCNPDLRSAISKIVDMLSTGQLPPADALVDGVPAKIDPRWWWAAAVEYPNSSAAFNLIIDAEPRLTRATEIALDRRAWERQRSRIAATAQQGEASGEPMLADMGEPQPSTHPESAQSPARASAPRLRAPDVEVRKWYEGTYIPECQTAGKRPSEAKDWAKAKLKFGNKVRRNQIRELRHALAPDDWRIQGRRPSSPNSAE